MDRDAVGALAAPPTDPLAFARANFDSLLVPFETFFDEYEAYQRASAEWDAKWGALYGASQPGWVAVQQHRAGLVSGAAPGATQTPAPTPQPATAPAKDASVPADADLATASPVDPRSDSPARLDGFGI